MCSGPVSPPTNSRLRATRARSSARSNSPKSTIRSAAPRQRLPRRRRDPAGRLAIRWTRTEHDPPPRSMPARARRSARRTPVPASVGTDCRRSRAPRSARAAGRDAGGMSRCSIRPARRASGGISTGSRAGSGAPRGHPRSLPADPTGSRPNAAAAAFADAATARVYIQRPARDDVPDSLGAPVSQRQPRAARDRRGNRSPGRNAPARSRRASRRSSDARQPWRPGATITSSRCGLPAHDRRGRRLDEIGDVGGRETPASAPANAAS